MGHFQNFDKVQGSNGGASQMKRHAAVVRLYRTLNTQGWDKVTIVNMHSFQLDLNMGYLGHITVKPKAKGEMYATAVIDKPRIDLKSLAEGEWEPRAVMPIELAQDFVKNNQDKGGVFCYIGTGNPPAELLEQAKDAQLKWYQHLYSEATIAWARNKQPRDISDRMRDAAKELYSLRLINNLPEWTAISRNESPDYPCEGCGTVIPKIASFCVHCHTIYDFEWVKLKRPDLFAAQSVSATAVAGADDAGLEELIKNADAAEKAPKNANSKQK
jgi:hypothetical protein